MKKILIPTDFSKNARNAALFAFSLFEKDQCKFYLLNTYEIPLSVAKEVISYNDIQRQKSVEKLQKWKGDLTIKLQNPQHIIEILSNLGNPVNVIRRRVLEDKFDILIIASQIGNGLEESNTECILTGVVKNANCPTIIVPEKTTFQIPNHILFVLDPETREINENLLSPLTKIAKLFKSYIYILSFAKRNQKIDTNESAGCELDFHLREIAHQFYFIENEFTTDHIENFIRLHPVDMIAMFSTNFSVIQQIFKYMKDSSTRIPLFYLGDSFSKRGH